MFKILLFCLWINRRWWWSFFWFFPAEPVEHVEEGHLKNDHDFDQIIVRIIVIFLWYNGDCHVYHDYDDHVDYDHEKEGHHYVDEDDQRE